MTLIPWMCFWCIHPEHTGLTGYTGNRFSAESLSITDYAADLTLLLEPLIPLPEVMLVQSALAPVQPHTYAGCQPSHAHALSVDPPPAVLSCKGPFDAFTESADTSDHPLISFRLIGCPYRMTTYREEDVAHVDTAFGV